MKLLCLLLILICLSEPERMAAREALSIPPQTIEAAVVELEGKTERQQLVLLSFWRNENILMEISNQKLDELYLNNPTLFEDYARLSNGSSVVRAVCLEVLRRHRNFNVNLSANEKNLSIPITGYERAHDPGLLDLRREWTIYRIERAEDPQDMFNQIKASEPQNAAFFDDIAEMLVAKTGGDAPKSLNGGRSAQVQKPVKLKEEGPLRSSENTTTPVLVAVIASGIGLLWLAFKNRGTIKKG